MSILIVKSYISRCHPMVVNVCFSCFVATLCVNKDVYILWIKTPPANANNRLINLIQKMTDDASAVMPNGSVVQQYSAQLLSHNSGYMTTGR